MLVVEGAPLGLEEEYEELVVLVAWKQVVNQPHFDVFHGMGEGTIVSILALLYLTREAVAEFCLVLIFVVESFNSVMRSTTLVFLGTALSISELAEFRGVLVIVPALVLDGVVEVATLVIVRTVLLWALVTLEILKLQVLDAQRLSGAVMGSHYDCKNLGLGQVVGSDHNGRSDWAPFR